MQNRVPWFLVFWLTLGLGCQPNGGPVNAAADGSLDSLAAIVTTRHKGSYPFSVACTTGMVADLVRQVGGPQVKVAQLMGAGVDPHLYKASPGDVRELMASDLIFYSGRNLEGKLSDLLVRLARKKPTIAVTHYIDESQILENAEQHHDPHLWFDVSLWAKGIEVVKEALALYDPAQRGDYAARARAYREELARLHAYAKEQMATIPKTQRVLVTAHDAFQYFGRAYDIEVRGIQGISTESEASVKEINELVELLVSRKVKAVFVETSVSEKNIKALVEGCRSRGQEVRIGGELYSDAMGEAGTPTGNYIGMVKHNVDTIVKALR
jgi:manganese/zinc/iron transport system substrate-binding protein